MVISVGQRISPVLLLNSQTVAELLTLKGCIPAVEAAFAAHAQGTALEPGLLHVASKGGEFHIKVGGLQGERTYFAAKINGGFFNNRAAFGLPNIIGLIVLCDGTRGTPLAVMESGLVTRLRTGAATAVAARYLARPDSRAVTICGAGIQGEIQLRALKEVLPIERVFIWSRSGAPGLAAQLRSALGIDAQAVSELGPAARASDVIITCTPAKGWFPAASMSARAPSSPPSVATVLTSRKSNRPYWLKAPWFPIFSIRPPTWAIYTTLSLPD